MPLCMTSREDYNFLIYLTSLDTIMHGVGKTLIIRFKIYLTSPDDMSNDIRLGA